MASEGGKGGVGVWEVIGVKEVWEVEVREELTVML